MTGATFLLGNFSVCLATGAVYGYVSLLRTCLNTLSSVRPNCIGACNACLSSTALNRQKAVAFPLYQSSNAVHLCLWEGGGTGLQNPQLTEQNVVDHTPNHAKWLH